jgi:predicted permease
VQPNEDAGVGYAIVTPGYFDALRIPILEGRDFTERDGTGAEGAVIVNEVVARRYWPGQSPIGRLTTYFGDRKARVVGVVKAGKYRSLSEPPRAFVYFPYQQGVWDLNLGVVLRTEGDPSTAVAALRRAVKASDSRVELWGTLTMEEYVAAAFLAHRIATTLLIALGVVALALAVMGIYGVMAYAVSQRTHEIGVRMALGAQAQDVQGLVLRQGLGLAALGLGLGFAGALGLTHLLAGFLYGVNPLDPMVFAGVALLLVGSSLAACYLPARRASRVDPLVALRYE